MSLRRNKSVSQIVEKYLRQYAGFDRDLVRKLIRLENPSINLRTVDRHLKRAYEPRPREPVLVNPMENLRYFLHKIQKKRES